MATAPTNEFSTVEDKIEVAEEKKTAADKAFRDGNWQNGEWSATILIAFKLSISPALRSYHEVLRQLMSRSNRTS